MDASLVQMGMGDYLFYSVFGICLVFCVLAVLILAIKILMTATDKFEEKKASEAAAPAAAPAAPAAERPLAPGTAGDLKLYDTDPRSAAMIMAIVADELGKPLNELRFISIKEVK
ncbi:MAG: OadG family transporter subunit [Anaerotardibacter sp.]